MDGNGLKTDWFDEEYHSLLKILLKRLAEVLGVCSLSFV